MADTLIPALVGEARNPHDLRVSRDPDGHLLIVVRGIIKLSLDGFLLTRALRDAGFADVDLINEVLEEAELVDDDLYGYLLGPGMIRRLKEVAQGTEEEPLPERPQDHNPQVVSNTRARGPHPRISYGWCNCGWRGPERSDSHAADEDVSAHLQAVLPDGAKGSIHR